MGSRGFWGSLQYTQCVIHSSENAAVDDHRLSSTCQTQQEHFQPERQRQKMRSNFEEPVL
eukprot:913990-Rhodomonas_salina.1